LKEVTNADKTISMKRSLILLIFCFLSLQLIFADDNNVFAPFVSRLKALTGQNTIKLTWLDSEDDIKEYNIYRGTSRIGNSSFSGSLKVGTVPQGKQIFIDIPEDTKSYFYAVLAVDKSGNEYKLFIPYRNITMEAVNVSSVSTPDQLAAEITGISTDVLDNEIKVSFSSSKPEREVAVYRSTSPIQEKEDLTNATLAGVIPSSRGYFIDKAVPGISYYYGIFDSELTKSGKFSFVPGENLTLNSVEIPLDIKSISPFYGTRTVRSEPLPFLDFFTSVDTGKTIRGNDFKFPPFKPLKAAVSDTVSSLLATAAPDTPPVPEIYIFPTDKDAVENSETYRLVRILNTDFVNKNWPEAYKLLGDYLSVRHTRDVELRTHFYLGQVLYFEKSYIKAFNEFVLAEGAFYKETKPWLDSILYLINASQALR